MLSVRGARVPFLCWEGVEEVIRGLLDAGGIVKG